MADPTSGAGPAATPAQPDDVSRLAFDSTNSAPAASTPGIPADWTDQIVDRIESVVGGIRTKTTDPVITVSRIVVYGLVATVLGVIALIFLVLAILRLHVYLPFNSEERRVWVTYAGLGAIFLALGMFLWRKRAPRKIKR